MTPRLRLILASILLFVVLWTAGTYMVQAPNLAGTVLLVIAVRASRHVSVLRDARFLQQLRGEEPITKMIPKRFVETIDTVCTVFPRALLSGRW